jgi:hypothetical protein
MKGEIEVSRRAFMTTAIAGGGSAIIGALSIPRVREEVDARLDRMSIQQRLSSEALSHRRSALTTAIQSIVMWVGNMTVSELLSKTKLEHGGHAGDGQLYGEQMETRPVKTYLRDNFLIPVVEEMLFRLLPSSLFAEEKPPQVKLHWEVGIASTLVFGMVHNFSKQRPDAITIHLKSLPLEQLIMGSYCWYAQRKGGFFHAAGAHVLYNNLCALYETHILSKESR